MLYFVAYSHFSCKQFWLCKLVWKKVPAVHLRSSKLATLGERRSVKAQSMRRWICGVPIKFPTACFDFQLISWHCMKRSGLHSFQEAQRLLCRCLYKGQTIPRMQTAPQSKLPLIINKQINRKMCCLFIPVIGRVSNARLGRFSHLGGMKWT